MDENINKTKRMIKVEPFDENSKRTKTIEKHALDVSNIAEEQKIIKEFKTEVKIEPINENINEEMYFPYFCFNFSRKNMKIESFFTFSEFKKRNFKYFFSLQMWNSVR